MEVKRHGTFIGTNRKTANMYIHTPQEKRMQIYFFLDNQFRLSK